TSVATAGNVAATFENAMDAATINATTFTLQQGSALVPGNVSYAGRTASFAADDSLLPDTKFTARITTRVLDSAGNALARDAVWSFTTGAAPLQAPIALGQAASFAVLAGAAITNTGPTSVMGDLGVSPSLAVVGFPPGTVSGSIHAGDGVASQAQASLTTAYEEAAGRTANAVAVSGNLGGLTLSPGLYHSTSSLEISSGDLNLDAEGNPAAVFLFQAASSFTMTSDRHVLLLNGAKASNVFWQVGSAATVGTNATLVGTVLAAQSITLNTGSILDGRAMARTGIVTMDTNTIAVPSP
ncbi:MAG TPA: ice-binding family protein, partial [Candidatus Thermoplasmatota archaeon]|nr:ice-binding family protein [Candidatus Thermoplasmatota archaeon]